MVEIIGAIFFIILLAFTVVVSMKLLVKDTTISKGSKKIVGKFVPDNSAPELTDMIDYHRNNETSKYRISE